MADFSSGYFYFCFRSAEEACKQVMFSTPAARKRLQNKPLFPAYTILTMRKWRIEDSEELYNIKGWGVNYFGINESGHAYVCPRKNNVRIDLRELVDELAERDIPAPVLLRFPDILDNRIEKTADCFERAEKEYDYRGEHFIIYPIKVNQMRPVVEEIISHGKKYNLGLECGSKPRTTRRVGHQHGLRLRHCLQRPQRSKLHRAGASRTKDGKARFSRHREAARTGDHCANCREDGRSSQSRHPHQTRQSLHGQVGSSGGDASKFGLNSSELLQALNLLEEKGLSDCPPPHSLPHREPNPQNPTHQHRPARDGTILCPTPQNGFQHRVRRLRWRSRGRLRRHTFVQL